MKQQPFGRTGITVSEVGFGGSRIGGVFAGRQGRREALEVLRRSLDAGITFYDTADLYAQGESETLIGEAFRRERGRVILATKGGFQLPARRTFIAAVKPFVRPIVQALGLKRARLPAGMSGALSQDFSPAYLARALDASLRRLQTDYVDLYQLHSPDAAFMQSAAFGDALQALERLKQQGKIRFYGIATETPEDAPFGLSAAGISSLQIGFGLLDLQGVHQGTLAAAHERGLAVIARGCFGGGLLKDTLDAAQLQAATSKWEHVLALREFAASRKRHPMDLALRFCRDTPAVSVTLLGMRTVDHLQANLRYAEGAPLSPEDYATLLAFGTMRPR